MNGAAVLTIPAAIALMSGGLCLIGLILGAALAGVLWLLERRRRKA